MESSSSDSVSRRGVSRLRSALWAFRTGLWTPLLFMAATLLAGALLLMPASEPGSPASASVVDRGGWPIQYEPTEYRKQPLSEILAGDLARDEGWAELQSNWSGLGYLEKPATFRVSIKNSGTSPIERWVVVPAPFLDQIRPVRIDSKTGRALPMATMGSLKPRSQRLLDLPFWAWPVNVPPDSETLLLFEVSNDGPVMLPVSVQRTWELAGVAARMVAWESLLIGLLLFGLVINLAVILFFRQKSIAWLTVLLVSILHSELVLSGFGLWLLWPNLPWINALTIVTMPVCLVSISQFARHHLSLGGWEDAGMQLLSFIGVGIIGAELLGWPFPGQGTLLVVGIGGSFLILALSLRRLQYSLNARYFALAMMMVGAGVSVASLRTVGWLPINTITNAGFSIGAVLATLTLTGSMAHLFIREQREKLRLKREARQEQSLRSRLQSDYHRLLRTHRATGYPTRPVFEEALAGLDPDREPYTVVCFYFDRYYEIERTVGYQHAEALLRTYLGQLEYFLEDWLGESLIRIEGACLATFDLASHAFAFRTSAGAGQEDFWVALSAWFEQDFISEHFVFSWGASAGVASAPEHASLASDMLSCAGFASHDPESQLTFYEPTRAEKHHNRQLLMLDLERGLGSGDVQLHYQYKVCLATGEVVGFEGLARWNHPEFGSVSPDDWIPAAEQLGAIHQVTMWALDRAAADLPVLSERYGNRIRVAVNISARDLVEPGFTQKAASVVRARGVEPERMLLEITETAVMSDEETARSVIKALGREGFHIALDDFGKGYSSLGTLAGLDLDELKIDRSFLADILESESRQRVFLSAIELADSLGLTVVVEGVESEMVVDWLKRLPGLKGQGFYWGVPLSVEELH
ncbi:EAL domain-containing protein (putative c-di-GMP-specific phosphodiesterase class I) [Halospina denitrificans]|uniref:EAL domain-containing protein (Putative c-di-GMP-specific phosphodiesterase class I) n=1 Tax=Halospina denitrificans TaxID=332522 RepID=A0A4R7K1N6_9GAMM|nr:EAL domain-containing protein [Halospina denitrificans]TDT43409.1 EAL domain-containing protein (putative c-di-GMP-specific phosphodiesterase class I) [Halospina denitrificans]